jgi:hypothetical protein
MASRRRTVPVDPGAIGPTAATTVRIEGSPGTNDMFAADLGAEAKR